jgi:hypothetical protein
MRIKERYAINKAAKVGEELICPSCGEKFVKTHVQQAFCKTKRGTVCKDRYWNTVTPHKRCNTTRISRANAEYYENHIRRSHDYDEHPFSSEALGQWNY